MMKKNVYERNKEGKEMKKYLAYVFVLCVMLVACGNTEEENHTELTQGTEIVQETESEFWIEIEDAADILLKTWKEYENGEHFKIMGGHFSAPSIGLPAKYDLSQTTDLVQMYCFPENQFSVVDDAATVIDLYNAARFTAGAYHVMESGMEQGLIDGIKSQVANNEWHGEKPEKLMIIKVDDQYVVSVYGREILVDQFKQKLESVYQTMIEVVVEEKLF